MFKINIKKHVSSNITYNEYGEITTLVLLLILTLTLTCYFTYNT